MGHAYEQSLLYIVDLYKTARIYKSTIDNLLLYVGIKQYSN